MILISLFFIFCLSSSLLILATRSRSQKSPSASLWRREGIAFVAAVLVAALVGIVIHSLVAPHLAAAPASGQPANALGYAKVAVNLKTSWLLLLTGVLFVVLAI